jgi:hypothetical protein
MFSFEVKLKMNGLKLTYASELSKMRYRNLDKRCSKIKKPLGCQRLICHWDKGNVMKNVCYLHHNGFLIFEQRLPSWSTD